jgi:hypothetical protein
MRVSGAGSTSRRLRPLACVRLALPLALALVAVLACAASAVAAVPILVKVNPHTGNVTGGETVELKGKDFAVERDGKEIPEVTSVMFGSVPAESYEVVSKTEILAVTPAHSAGRVVVTVSTADGTSSPTPKDDDEFGFQEPTVANELSPDFGPALGGTFVTITGTGFAEGSTETKFIFGTQAATTVECTSHTSCLVITPAAVGMRPGHPLKVPVVVKVGGKSSKRKGAPEFEYEAD